MKIEELPEELPVTLVATIGSETLELTTVIKEVIPKKHIATAEPIYRNDMIISFRAKGLIVDLVTQLPDSPPIIFKNITVHLMKREDGSLCYALTTLAEGKVLNRRGSFRCFVGIPSSVQAGGHTAAHDAMIKDVSTTGFSVTCSDETDYRINQVLHVILNDYFEETAENFNFHLYGIIVRIEELENDKVVYGCRLNSRVVGLDAYIMKKERLRIKKQRGS